MSAHAEHWPDIGYTCVAEPVQSGDGPPLIVAWKVYSLHADQQDPESFIVEGRTKWDGCSDFAFSINISGRTLHACDRHDMLTLGTLLARVHDLVGHMLPDTRDFTPESLP